MDNGHGRLTGGGGGHGRLTGGGGGHGRRAGGSDGHGRLTRGYGIPACVNQADLSYIKNIDKWHYGAIYSVQIFTLAELTVAKYFIYKEINQSIELANYVLIGILHVLFRDWLCVPARDRRVCSVHPWHLLIDWYYSCSP